MTADRRNAPEPLTEAEVVLRAMNVLEQTATNTPGETVEIEPEAVLALVAHTRNALADCDAATARSTGDPMTDNQTDALPDTEGTP